MGKIILSQTREQQAILDAVAKDRFLSSQFYYTGGTALSSVYLHHRESEDLDFFSSQQFNHQTVVTVIEGLGEKLNFTINYRFIEVVSIFRLTFPNQIMLKVDFSYYPGRKLEKEQVIDGIQVDSLIDIAVNKLFTISQRTEVKDFVDLYFLLQEFSLWDLIHGADKKFHAEIDPLVLASDFLKAQDFNSLPTMIKPLSLIQLQEFYQEKAKEVGKKSLI